VASVPREGLYILLAVGCGIGGYLAQRHFVDTEIDAYKSQLTNKEMVVALKQRVRTGQVLDAGMLEGVGIPKQFAHPRAVRWEERNSVVGNPVVSPVEKGEVLLWHQMDMGVSASVNDKISEGEKAVTLPVNTVTGSGGLLRPNMRIDIYGTFSIPVAAGDDGAPRQELVATRLLENVVVVAVGTESGLDYGDGTIGRDKAAYNTVTVLVKEKQVEKVLLAMELANAGGTGMYCVLRSEMDKAEGSPRMVPASEFLSGLKPRNP